MKQVTARQQEIIAAALALIADRGLEALTLKNIAERVGFSDAAVYRHFRNKAEILAAIIELFARDSRRLLAEIQGCSGPELEKVRLFFLDRCRAFSADRVLATVMFAENLFPSDPLLAAEVQRMLRSHRRLLLQSLRGGQRQGKIRALPADHLFDVIMGSLRLLVLQWRISGYGFDLMRAGEKLWRSLEILLVPPQGE
jgi:AcrR family transcriptional regulator